jgi:hypothetical protein
MTNGNKRAQMGVPICARLFSRPCFPLNVSTTRKRHSLSRPDAALGIFHTCMLKSGGDFMRLARLSQPTTMPIKRVLISGCVSASAKFRHHFASSRAQNDEACPLWRGFARLSEHPRFDAIPDWPQQLEAVLRGPMAWYHAQSIVRVLERDSGSYTLIEARLFKEANWEHYREDEVERLDRAAEALFSQFRDSRTTHPDLSSSARTA